MRRSRICRYLGSRSLSSATIGAATNGDEYAPTRTPTNSANAKSFSVSPPKNSNASSGINTVIEVFTDRMNT